MKIVIDTESKTIETTGDDVLQRHPLYSESAFELISDLWVKVGWARRYSYSFTWMGRPIIQLPEDMIRIQELIFRLRPDFVVETGIARGGSLIYYASLMEILGKGEVIGVDIEVRPENRGAVEAHPMFSRIHMIEGSSTAPGIVDQVRQRIGPEDVVLVILDSNHSRAHVLDELRAYAPMVSLGSYAVATDGIMNRLTDVPGGQADWEWDNPETAARDFATERDDFVLEEPERLFDHSEVSRSITYWPGAYLKRVR